MDGRAFCRSRGAGACYIHHMDNTDKFLESLSFDHEGLSRQFMSLSSFFNILIASAVGFMILAVYLASSGRERRDKNLYMVIPILSVLMAVIMRVEGTQALAFLGILGILSVIRFRSEITDQRGVTFILFAVIEGVIVGVNAYLLAALAWLVVSGSILIGRYAFSNKVSYRLVARFKLESQETSLDAIRGWLDGGAIACSFTGLAASSDHSEKKDSWEESCRAEYALFPRDEAAWIGRIPEFVASMRQRGIEVEVKRLNAG
jgi:hypothetical protein